MTVSLAWMGKGHKILPDQPDLDVLFDAAMVAEAEGNLATPRSNMPFAPVWIGGTQLPYLILEMFLCSKTTPDDAIPQSGGFDRLFPLLKDPVRGGAASRFRKHSSIIFN